MIYLTKNNLKLNDNTFNTKYNILFIYYII